MAFSIGPLRAHLTDLFADNGVIDAKEIDGVINLAHDVRTSRGIGSLLLSNVARVHRERFTPGALRKLEGALAPSRSSGINLRGDHPQRRADLALGRHHRGARWVDRNRNGIIDRGDAVRLSDGGVQPIENARAKRLRLEAAMLAAGEAMAQAEHGFTLMEDGFEVNPALWEPAPYKTGLDFSTFRSREGVRASEALQDLFLQPELYSFECATAKALAFHKGLLQLWGPEKFDRVFTPLRLGPNELRVSLAPYVEFVGRGLLPDEKHRAALPVGAGVYFKNWGATQATRDIGWGGENAIYLGGDQFWGHGIGIASESAILAALDEHDKVDASTVTRVSAAMVPKHTQLRADVI